MDEKYYNEPENFKPERFVEKGTGGKNLFDRPYLPFGDGPRNCIGMRLGKLQTKVGLILMLQQFKYALKSEDTNQEVIFDPKQFLLSPKSIIKLRILRRKPLLIH